MICFPQTPVFFYQKIQHVMTQKSRCFIWIVRLGPRACGMVLGLRQKSVSGCWHQAPLTEQRLNAREKTSRAAWPSGSYLKPPPKSSTGERCGSICWCSKSRRPSVGASARCAADAPLRNKVQLEIRLRLLRMNSPHPKSQLQRIMTFLESP